MSIRSIGASLTKYTLSAAAGAAGMYGGIYKANQGQMTKNIETVARHEMADVFARTKAGIGLFTAPAAWQQKADMYLAQDILNAPKARPIEVKVAKIVPKVVKEVKAPNILPKGAKATPKKVK